MVQNRERTLDVSVHALAKVVVVEELVSSRDDRPCVHCRQARRKKETEKRPPDAF